MTDTDMLYMATLEKRNAELEARIAELEDKHHNECGQIAHYDDELKDLREENKVLISECDRLIKEKGELLKKSEQIAKYKSLLKAAVEDFTKVPCNNDAYNPNSCGICVKQNNCNYSDSFKWRYADEALALIGGGENGT